MPEPNYDTIVHKQLTWNKQTWKVLTEKGITEQSSVRLDFFYYAPTKDAADHLVGLLRHETDYEISPLRSEGPFWRKRWSVSGSTQAILTRLSLLDRDFGNFAVAGLR
jgi:hypothetical protein